MNGYGKSYAEDSELAATAWETTAKKPTLCESFVCCV
jgi:hypothetical protein